MIYDQSLAPEIDIARIENYEEQLIEKQDKDELIQSLNILYRARASGQIWRLPIEVISYIFVHCLPTNIDQLSPKYSWAAPMLLTKICQRWREIALGLPILWCRLCVTGNWEKGHFETWLERAQGCPLSLKLKNFRFSGYLSRPDDEHPLMPYSNQILSLDIDSVKALNFSLEALRSIQELIIDGNDFGAIENMNSFFQRTSTLRSLISTERNTVSFTEPCHPYPVLPQLTNLMVAVLDSRMRQIFDIGCNLSSLTIHTLLTGEEKNEGEPLVHTNLRTLRISTIDFFPSIFIFTNMFNALTLPNLCMLEVSFHYQYKDIPWSHNTFKRFLTRSKCPLRSLTFGSCTSVTDEEIAEYRALVPSLLEAVRDKECLSCPSMQSLRRRGVDRLL